MDGAQVGESTVRRFVALVKAHLVGTPQVAVPQTDELGAEAEVDFGKFCAWFDGVWTRLWLFVMRLSASGKRSIMCSGISVASRSMRATTWRSPISQACSVLPHGVVPCHIQGFEEAEDLGEVVWAEDREGTVTYEQVRSDGCDAVDISWHRVDRYAVVESDPRRDQRTALDSSLNDEQDIAEPRNHTIPGREPPAANP